MTASSSPTCSPAAGVEECEAVADLPPATARTPLGQLLTALRRECGYTQVELAERTGMTQSAVSRLERSDDAHLSTIRRYIQGCGVSSYWLEVTP